MRLKNSFFFTLRENVKDEDSVSGNLLVRSGMIKKIGAGIYSFLPLGYIVSENIKKIVRDEMNKAGAQELLMPSLIPNEIYEKSGRTKTFGASIFKLKDRFDKPYILGPTHEELFAIAGSLKVKSYKDLPFNLYQFQNKFRDEARPRYGLIRVREFCMKDAYSFDTDLEGLDVSYNKMMVAYKNIFDKLKLKYKIVTSDTGIMGGLLSEEFQAITDIGEDIVVLCDNCDYSSNIDISTSRIEKLEKEAPLPKKMVETKNVRTIEEVTTFMNLPATKFVKTLIYDIDGKLYACLIKGNREINETKLSKLVKGVNIALATPEQVMEVTHAEVGFAGPVGIDIPVIADEEVLEMSNFVVGANKTDYHYENINVSDFRYLMMGDIRTTQEGDICPICGGKIHFNKGIEIGNLFKLGTKYSEAFNLSYLDSENKLHPVVMGSYGIGIGRIMTSIVEQNNDEKGIVWPLSIAPYKVGIILINSDDEKQLSIAEELYQKLTDSGIECLLDDRDERPGVKFNDLDLIGLPIKITVGKTVNEGNVELKLRRSDEVKILKTDEVIDYIKNIVSEE